jgi:hypothetical protein
MAMTLGIRDSRAFVRVAYIHNAGYLGGLIGLIMAIFTVKRLGYLNSKRDIRIERRLEPPVM